MERRPSVAQTTLAPVNPAAFWLSVAGLVVQGLAALTILTMRSAFSGFGMMGYYGGMMGGYYGGGWGGFLGVWVVVAAAGLVLGILGVLWMSSKDLRTVRNGSVLVLIAAVVAFPMMWGFWIGSILMVVGALMGLTAGPAYPGAPVATHPT